MIRRGIGVLFCVCCLTGFVVGENSVNVAMNKNYSQISAHAAQGNSSDAANNDTRGTYPGDNNCIHTLPWDPINEYHWWEVDLGGTFPVYNITVWARTNYRNRLFPSNITVDGRFCATVTSDQRKGSVTCSSVMHGRKVRITLNTREGNTLNMCEFKIFACRQGFHGGDCSQACNKNCEGGCNQANGRCADCTAGSWGSETCDKSCPTGCAGACDRVNGHCDACNSGFWGTKTCDNRCSAGCAGTCARVNGHCDQCEDGYYKQSVPPCIQCPGTCDNNTPCDKTTGHCQQCPPGKRGDTCDEEKPANQNNNLVVLVVSSVIGACVVIAIAAVGSVCWYRRSRGGPAAKRDTRSTVKEPVNAIGDNGTETFGRQPPSSSSPQEDKTYYEISDTANPHEMQEMQNNYEALHPYSNDDADRQPYSEIKSYSSDVTKTSANAAYVNNAFHNARETHM